MFFLGYPVETLAAYNRGSEHPAHGPIGREWGDNAGRFYWVDTELHMPVLYRVHLKALPLPQYAAKPFSINWWTQAYASASSCTS